MRSDIVAGLILWGSVAVLAFAASAPPGVVEHVWLWFAAYAGAAAMLHSAWRMTAAIRRGWAASPRPRRWAVAAAALVTVMAGGLAMRFFLPRPFGRLSRENGLWEPMSLVLYWTAAMLTWRESRGAGPAERRAWLAVVGFYVLMGLEEIDYFGIFGGIIGRIDGVYAGSLHDLIMLVKRGVLQPAVLAGLVILAVAGLVILWRKGLLAPALVLSLAARREVVWLLAGLTLLFAAAAEEAHILGWAAEPPTPEEVVELAGALCLAVYALELAAERLPGPARGDDQRPASAAGR